MNCKLEKSLFFFSVIFLATSLWAVPADPTPFTVDNAGDALTLRNVGDEYYNYTQTVDGYLVTQDANGVYFYLDENGESSQFKAKNAENRNLLEISYLKSLDVSKVKQKHFQLHPNRFTQTQQEKDKASWVPSKETSQEAESTYPAVLQLPSPAGHATGTNRFPVLLVASSDSANCDSASFYALVNEVGYSLNGHIGSVKDYFRDQSDGIFEPSFDIFLVSVSGQMSSYVQKEYQLIKEAISALRTKYSDFDASLYDKNKDGEVDMVGVMYAGQELKVDEVKLGGFAHRLEYYSIGKQNAGGGKKFNRFFILPQMKAKATLMPIAQFVHEFCHTMGLADHYCVAKTSNCYDDFTNSPYQAPGAHAWDVMATGMYNGPVSGATPIGLSAFEKAFLGWIHYDSLKTVSENVVVLPPFGESGKALVVPVAGNKDEWFVLENRQKNGWDKNLPNSGLLIWHIDYNETAWIKNVLNDNPAHQRIDVVEAGNLKINSYGDGFFNYEETPWSILMGYGKNLKDDPYPGSQNVTEFSGFQSWDGDDLGIRLYSITEKNNKVCFATTEGVDVGDCLGADLSSEKISSSSENGSSSGFDASSSSSQIDVSSSSTQSLVISQVPKNSLNLLGNTLKVSSNVAGTKNVTVYDLSGKVILQKNFNGNTLSLNLQKQSHKIIIVNLSQNGKMLRQKKFVNY